jgi:hypothetical protein
MTHYETSSTGPSPIILPAPPGGNIPGYDTSSLASNPAAPQPAASWDARGVTAQAAPTQTTYPWRSTARTAVQAAVGLLLLVPVLDAAGYLGSVPWLLPVVPLAAGLARVLAVPQVETWLKTWFPWLSAQPPLSHQDGTAGR